MKIFDIGNFCKQLFLSCFLYCCQNLSAFFFKKLPGLYPSPSCHPSCSLERSVQSLMGLENQSLLPPERLFQRNAFSYTALRFRSNFPEQIQRYFPLFFKLSVKCPHILVYSSLEKVYSFH